MNLEFSTENIGVQKVSCEKLLSLGKRSSLVSVQGYCNNSVESDVSPACDLLQNRGKSENLKLCSFIFTVKQAELDSNVAESVNYKMLVKTHY